MLQLAFVSMAHTEEDIDYTLRMAAEVFKVIPVDLNGTVQRPLP